MKRLPSISAWEFSIVFGFNGSNLPIYFLFLIFLYPVIEYLIIYIVLLQLLSSLDILFISIYIFNTIFKKSL